MEIERDFNLELFIGNLQGEEEKIVTLLAQLQYHHPEIYRHSIRVGDLAVLLAKFITDKAWTAEELCQLRLCGFLHDIGKLRLTREILYNPIVLFDDDLRKAQRHTIKGAAILRASSLPKIYSTVATQHHENYIGNGYPYQRTGDNINLYAKIVRVADVFDASINPHRPGKKPLSFEEAVDSINADFANGRFDSSLKIAFGQLVNYLRSPLLSTPPKLLAINHF